ncbi:hypothetical protein L207DRAFT_629422 [Hyaloscypha variabilis F]|uniref:Uncharacterized protein n=1 Tax=Hyaloscypha variabilis (strain UAMH 11265 / GT02V1 / F) TaxID=1149755 RepID=A0A2J6S2A1_HYAVF|nr:hypothetical protein L207DRAFT_629422 [Hyaloscypha variabilis F]
MSTLTPQWNLDRTTNDLIGISRGILEAATSDNVQVLALIACESFGTNIAMSQESCHKAYLLCSRSHESTVISFLKAKIGYRDGDCGWQLSQSHAGVRFLGLAACFSTLDSWNAAVILHNLLYLTAADKKLVPTTQHLKQLMMAVEDRLAKSGFSESALGWATILSKEMETQAGIEGPQLSMQQKKFTMAAPNKAIVELTQAMSCLARVGEETRRIEITTTSDNAAWFIAFVKWCLGAPPTIVSYNGRTLAENASQVIIRLIESTGKSHEVRIDLHEYTGNIKNLVRDVSSNSEFKGLVRVGVYGQAMLRQLFGPADDLRHRACVQALPYACGQVRQNLVVRREWSIGNISTVNLDQWGSPDTTATKGQVFASFEKIGQILHDYLGHSPDEPNPPLTELSSGMIIADLPLMSLVKSRMFQDCPCRSCQNTTTKAITSCKFDAFLFDVSYCVADILALSLLNPVDPDGVQVYFGSYTRGQFSSCIQSILSGKDKGLVCSISDIIEPAVKILGHELSDKYTWVMSSRYDQTVYPRLFSTQTIQSEEILTLECVPGSLIWGDKRYSSAVVGPKYRSWDFEDEDSDSESATGVMLYEQTKLGDGEALHPKDSFSGYEMKWQLDPREANIEVALSLRKFSTLPERNPRYALESAAESLYVNCTHDRMASFTPRNSNIYITQPPDPRPHSSDRDSIAVVHTDRNEQIRLFTLASGRPGVIRMDSCLECCVKYCHLSSLRFVLC